MGEKEEVSVTVTTTQSDLTGAAKPKAAVTKAIGFKHAYNGLLCKSSACGVEV